MRLQSKPTFILFGIALVLALFVLFISISSFFRPPAQTPITAVPTPTTVSYTRDAQGIFHFTPLQKTVIGKTTQKEIEEKEQILSKSYRGDITIYQVPSATVGEKDEIRTENGIVIFESTNIFNKATGDFPPKATVYEQEFGQPEAVLNSVSPLGQYISAHIYAKNGFTLFVNSSTDTVYVIQRYTPMSTEAYEIQYAEYLQPAPAYPKDIFQQP